MEIVWLGFTEFLAQFDRFYRVFFTEFSVELALGIGDGSRNFLVTFLGGNGWKSW